MNSDLREISEESKDHLSGSNLEIGNSKLGRHPKRSLTDLRVTTFKDLERPF